MVTLDDTLHDGSLTGAVQMVRYRHTKSTNNPKYGPCTGNGNRVEKSQKKQKSVFRQNGGENYFRFRLSLQVCVLRPRLGRKCNNSSAVQKCDLTRKWNDIPLSSSNFQQI